MLKEVSSEKYLITKSGLDYISNFNPEIDLASNLSSVDLTNEQKKVILKIITNGNWTNHKVNVYWFLRFIEVTNGEWLPNTKIFSENKLDLVDRIRTETRYDRVYLTLLGIEINNIFSLALQLKKTRLNLNIKFLD